MFLGSKDLINYFGAFTVLRCPKLPVFKPWSLESSEIERVADFSSKTSVLKMLGSSAFELFDLMHYNFGLHSTEMSLIESISRV